MKLVVIWFLIECEAVNLLDKGQKKSTLVGWAYVFGLHGQFCFANLDEVIGVRALVVVPTLALALHELEVAIHDVDEEVSQRD